MAAKFLHQLNVYCVGPPETVRQFNLSAHSLCDLFLRCLGEFETRGIAKVLIRVVSAPEDLRPPHQMDDVIESFAVGDVESYWQLEELERQRWLANLVYGGMKDVARRFNWNVEAIDHAHTAVERLGFRNVQAWKRPVASPDRKVRAQLWYDFNQRAIDGTIRFTNANGTVLGERKVFTLPPTDFDLHMALGRLRWLTNTKVGLESRDRKQRWETHFET